ncbi:MAG: PAS domain S-box protein [Salinirussus sp.]
MQLSSHRDIRVLHVDDDPGITDLTATFLERESERVSVETATSADEGLELLTESEFDCIVSDYQMPGMNGIEFLESVAEDHPDLPFILYTGKGSEEVASEAIGAGVTDYLQKETGTDHYDLLANRILRAVNTQRHERRIQFFETLEKELTELAIDFLRVEGDDIDSLVDRTLGRLGTLVDADRTYVFDVDHEAETLSNTYEWCSEGVEPQIDMLQDIPQETVPWWTQRLKNFENITIPNVSELPPAAAAEQELLQNQNIESLIVTPMISDGELVGFIGFDWVEEQEAWSDEFINVLRMVSELITTARRRKERRQELEEFETIIEALGDAVYVLDEEGQFTYVSDEFVELVGYDQDRLLGSRPSLIKGEEAVEQADRQLGRLLSSDGPETGTFEVTVQSREGESIVCEDNMGVLPYDGEEFNGSVGTLRDLTDRKNREQELRELKNQYETLAENFPDGAVFLIDADLKYVRAGGEELRSVGLTPGDVEGRTPHDLFPEEIADVTCHYYEEALAGTANTFEQEYGGEQYQVQTVPVRTDDEEIEYVMAVSQNVTERVADKRELERQNDRLAEFASIVSHDLRNPLRVADGRLELLRDDCESDHIDDIAQALDRMDALIEDLLTLAREGDQVDETEPVELASVAEDSWQIVNTEQATLEADATRTIEADQSRLRQLFENLYRNAVEHGGDSVTVSVGTMNDGFYVADTGSGIPESDQEEVFEAGYSTDEEGTGFGLRIVEQVVDAHGWEITVTESDQGGARFEFTGVEEGE